jgi:hypothetical protein
MLVLVSVLRWTAPRLTASPDYAGWLDGAIEALGYLGIPVVGALIASRQPANPYGWLWCAVGLTVGLSALTRPLVRTAGWPAWVVWVMEGWTFVSFVSLFVFVFLLFPDGRLPTARWRWLPRAALSLASLLALSVPFIYDPAEPTAATPWALRGPAGNAFRETVEAGVLAMVGLVLVGMSSSVLRFRRGGPVERRQLTWFLYATVLNAVVILLDVGLGVLPDSAFTTVVRALGFALLPIAVGIAVLRYRLYEIDRIVSRTVSYGLLSAGLVGLYLGVVALLRPLLEPLTGSSALAVAGSTLAVAAVFNPARRRLQAAVDRRFNRAHYDAARAVDAFAARLRQQVDLDEVTEGLRDTVASTVAPSRVGVWLSIPSGRPKG